MGTVLIGSIIISILYVLIVAKAPVAVRRNYLVRLVGVLSLGLSVLLLAYQFLPRYVFIICLVLICGGLTLLFRGKK